MSRIVERTEAPFYARVSRGGTCLRLSTEIQAFEFLGATHCEEQKAQLAQLARAQWIELAATLVAVSVAVKRYVRREPC